MRTILFHLPAQLSGIPLLGFGWLFGLWTVVSIALTVSAMRTRPTDSVEEDASAARLSTALLGLVLYVAIGGIVIGFLLPKLEETDGLGTNLGLPIRGYGVAMFFAVSAGVGLAIVRGGRRGLDSERIVSLAIWMFLPGILGARILYLVEYGHEIQAVSWIDRIGKFANIASGGLVVYGSLIGALLGFGLFTKRHRLPILAIADLIGPSMLLGLAIGRMGCFLNGCCYGGPCEYPWGVHFPTGSPPYERQLDRGLQHGLYWSAIDPGTVKPTSPADVSTATGSVRPLQITYVDPDGPAAKAGVTRSMQLTERDGQRLAAAFPNTEVSIIDRSADPPDAPHRWKTGRLPQTSLPTHPTQIYSALNAVALTLFLLALSPFLKRDGSLLAITLILYPVTRFLLEIVRIDEPALNQLGWTVSQTISIGILPIGIGLAFYVSRQPVGKQFARSISNRT